jgi:hypothetical protein
MKLNVRVIVELDVVLATEINNKHPERGGMQRFVREAVQEKWDRENLKERKTR